MLGRRLAEDVEESARRGRVGGAIEDSGEGCGHCLTPTRIESRARAREFSAATHGRSYVRRQSAREAMSCALVNFP